jgi:hypothetical protein
LVNAEAAGFDNAFFQAPALRTGVLEIQISIIDLVCLNGGQCPAQVGFVQAKRLKQEGPGCGQAFNGGFA